MNREEIVNSMSLQDAIQVFKDTNTYGTMDIAKTVILKALEQTRWIPVSERLPEKNVEVFATTEWGSVTIAERYSANDYYIHEGATNANEDDIVAWMPLPHRYEPQEKAKWVNLAEEIIPILDQQGE